MRASELFPFILVRGPGRKRVGVTLKMMNRSFVFEHHALEGLMVHRLSGAFFQCKDCCCSPPLASDSDGF